MRLLALVFLGTATLAAASEWTAIEVPKAWENQAEGKFATHDGFAWYRCFVKVPEAWRGRRLLLSVGQVDDVDEVYFNSDQVGVNGGMPPFYGDPSSTVRRPAVIDPDQVRYGEANLIAWRVYDKGGQGGILGGPVQLATLEQAIDLAGRWEFALGDNAAWAQWPTDDAAAKFLAMPGAAGTGPLVAADFASRARDLAAVSQHFEGNPNDYATTEGKGPPLPPREALARMEVAKDFALDLVLSEPEVRQPLYLDFDERGRLWVTQYIQYPTPAGLRPLTWDNHLRVVFDAVPPPPPYRGPAQAKFIGKDKITIHEDSDGDGVFEHHKTFLEGGNILTSTALGRGGVWVLNPPYLLFYPDANQDDLPDGAPVVHLSGFGLEDTHSVANSLKWGPDGWLYGATGSTVTARIRAELAPQAKPLLFFGQTVWRYHPERHVFELVAEGGYNTFGADFDDQGRLYSGTNGDTHVVHYIPGAYYRKGFGKHGPHTNPHAFDYFDTVPLENGDKLRLVHQWLDYGGGRMTGLANHLFGPNSLSNTITLLRKEPKGSSFTTTELPMAVASKHKWFRPVHVALGPDGFLYVADFYDARITHVDPRDNWDRSNGRIYRLRNHESPAFAPFNLRRKTTPELVALLGHRNRWFRHTALRLLADRQDRSIAPKLAESLTKEPGQLALESLWALHLLQALDAPTANAALRHPNPHVRLWAVRLLADGKEIPQPCVAEVVRLAREDHDAEVASQLASSIQRLPFAQGMPLLRALLEGDRFTSDPHIPTQLWWALESLAGKDTAETVRAVSQESGWWRSAHFRARLGQRLMRRLAANPSTENLQHAAGLLAAAPDAEAVGQLILGLDAGLQGISLSTVPSELSAALAKHFATSVNDPKLLGLAVRLRSPSANAAAMHYIATPAQPAAQRVALLARLAENSAPEMAKLLSSLLRAEKDEVVLAGILQALRRQSDPGLADEIIGRHAAWPAPLRATARAVLCGRLAWARAFVMAVEAGKIPRASVAVEDILVLRGYRDAALQTSVKRIFGEIRQPSERTQQRMAEVRQMLQAAPGDATAGQAVFASSCAACHRLHGAGSAIGPDLTGYEKTLDFLLPAVVDPNLAVREEFELVTIHLRPAEGETEGLVLAGFVKELTDATLKLADLAGQETVLARRDILTKENSPISIMPEGLLDALTAQQVRDLFAYLMSPASKPK